LERVVTVNHLEVARLTGGETTTGDSDTGRGTTLATPRIVRDSDGPVHVG